MLKLTPFISAGHHLKDPGAIATHSIDGKLQTFKEADLTMMVRDGVNAELKKLYGDKLIIHDQDTESLGQYLGRIKTGSGSVVCEWHFDAGGPSATGATAIVGIDADTNDKAFAMDMLTITCAVLDIKRRGVINEGESHRGRLGLMREKGIVCLLEIGFITNINDLQQFLKKKELLYVEYARIIKQYDDLIP